MPMLTSVSLVRLPALSELGDWEKGFAETSLCCYQLMLCEGDGSTVRRREER
jgi:hypothetical protein